MQQVEKPKPTSAVSINSLKRRIAHPLLQQFVQPHRLTCHANVDHASADKRSDRQQQSVAGVQAIESATHRHVGKL